MTQAYEQRQNGVNFLGILTELLSQATSKYELSYGGLMKYVPEDYRPFLEAFRDIEWPKVVDMGAKIVKEYGKDSKTEDVVNRLLKELGKNLLKKVAESI